MGDLFGSNLLVNGRPSYSPLTERGALGTMFDDPAFSPQVIRVLVDGDQCAVHLRILRGGLPVAAVVDIYRAKADRIVEHWDVIQPWPATSANEHPMF